MTVRTRSLVSWFVGFVAVGLVFGGLSVEVITGSQVSRARRALPGALARAVAFIDPTDVEAEGAGAVATRQLVVARRHAQSGRFEEAAAALEVVLAEHPSAPLHRLAARARLAGGDGMAAGRHAQLAARLAPEDAQLAVAAEEAIDLAVAWSMRPMARPLGALGGFALFLLLMGSWRGAHHRRRRESFLDSVTARLRLWADGEPISRGAIVPGNTESLVVDIFLSGRYGMACPRKPKQGPTMHLVWSNANSSQTIRQRPIKDVRNSAVRVTIQPDTLQRVLAEPGAWRLHARLGDRPLVTLPVTVAPPLPERVRQKKARRGIFRLAGT